MKRHLCPLCENRLVESMCRIHGRLLNYGYYQNGGRFYLSDTKAMHTEAGKIGFDVTKFIENK